MVKKARGPLAIVQDFGKMLDKGSDECRAALSHLRGNQSSQVLHVLTPLTVLSLFKKMLDEVDAFPGVNNLRVHYSVNFPF